MIDAKITALAPWFGSKRTLAPFIAEQLGPHAYYFEPCAGSMAVLFAKEPSEHETAVDLHRGLTNLAWIVQREDTAVALFDRLQRVAYDDDVYYASIDWLADNEERALGHESPDADLAYHYFIASWMGRNGCAGTAMINYQIATRWTQGGGSGPLRFKNAVASIPAWWDRLRNVHVLCRDLFEVVPKIEDAEGVVIYADPPYLPGTVAANSRYVWTFTDADHRRLAGELHRFERARVLVSYYASPVLAELYPDWTVLDYSRHKHLAAQNKRGRGRTEAPEVLLINGPAFESPAVDRFAMADLFG